MSPRPTPAERRAQALADVIAGQPAERHLPPDVQAQMATVLRYVDMTLADLEASRRKGYLARAVDAVRQLQTVLVLPDAVPADTGARQKMTQLLAEAEAVGRAAAVITVNGGRYHIACELALVDVPRAIEALVRVAREMLDDAPDGDRRRAIADALDRVEAGLALRPAEGRP